MSDRGEFLLLGIRTIRLIEERTAELRRLAGKMDELCARAESERRDLHPHEAMEFDTAEAEVIELRAEIDERRTADVAHAPLSVLDRTATADRDRAGTRGRRDPGRPGGILGREERRLFPLSAEPNALAIRPVRGADAAFSVGGLPRRARLTEVLAAMEKRAATLPVKDHERRRLIELACAIRRNLARTTPNLDAVRGLLDQAIEATPPA